MPLANTIFITKNRALFHLRWDKALQKISKILKIFWPQLQLKKVIGACDEPELSSSIPFFDIYIDNFSKNSFWLHVNIVKASIKRLREYSRL